MGIMDRFRRKSKYEKIQENIKKYTEKEIKEQRKEEKKIASRADLSKVNFWSEKKEETERIKRMREKGYIPKKYESEGKLKSIAEQEELLEEAHTEAKKQRDKALEEALKKAKGEVFKSDNYAKELARKAMEIEKEEKSEDDLSKIAGNIRNGLSDIYGEESKKELEKAEEEKKKYKCPVCGNEMDSPHGPCPVCGWTRKGKTHVYTNAIITIAIAAIIAFILPMIFGSDPGVLLISAGIIFVAMETLFGSGGAGGYVRAVFRTMGYIFIAIGFTIIFGKTPVLKIIPLMVLAFEIVSFPMPEEIHTEADKGMQIMRMILGIVLTGVFGYVFWDILAVNPGLFSSFISLSIAFFIALPISRSVGKDRIDDIINRIGVEFGESFSEGVGKGIKKYITKSTGLIKWIVFFIIIWIFFAFAGKLYSPLSVLGRYGVYGIGAIIGMLIFIIGVSYSANRKDFNGVILGGAGGAGIIFGSLALSGSPIGFFLFVIIVTVGIIAAAPVVSARPLIGVPIIFLAIMAATFAYPDIMGQATFGVWWPTIDRTIENTLGPLQSTIMGPFASMQRGYACLADPVGCMQNYQPQTSTKEVPRAVEITSLEPMGADSVTMPDQDLLVLLDVQNLGKDAAENIYVEPIQPRYSQGTPTGKKFGKATIIADNEQKSEYKISKLLKNELREFVLNYTFGEESGGKTYLRRGNFITYGAKIKYNYNVSAKLKVNIMNHNYYYNLAKNDKLTRAEQITEDTGGPVRLGIAVMKNEMPIPDNIGAKVPVMVYIENQGQGTIYKINNIYVDLTSLGGTYCSLDGEGGHKIEGIISGYLDKDVEPGKTLKGICFIKLPSLEDDVDQKTYLITANMSYGYAFYKYNTIPVDFGAFAQCECVNKEDESKKDYILVYSCDECDKDSEGDICEGVFGDYEYNGNCIGKQKSD